jgi:hypothetical protein
VNPIRSLERRDLREVPDSMQALTDDEIPSIV